MNIKNLIGNLAPVTSATNTGKVETRPIKMENTEERDANGQELYHRQQRKEKMTDEQFEKAIAILREKPFMKEMNWSVLASVENEIKIAWVQDQQGQTIRKIMEWDLWEIFDDTKANEPKGQLLKRTA